MKMINAEDEMSNEVALSTDFLLLTPYRPSY